MKIPSGVNERDVQDCHTSMIVPLSDFLLVYSSNTLSANLSLYIMEGDSGRKNKIIAFADTNAIQQEEGKQARLSQSLYFNNALSLPV